MLVFSHFSAIRNYEAWTQSYPAISSHPILGSSPAEELYAITHAVIVILFDSKSPKNKNSHLKRLRGQNSNYNFTVKQRRLVMGAETAKNIQELEDWVSRCYAICILGPKLLSSLTKNFKKAIEKMTALSSWILICL